MTNPTNTLRVALATDLLKSVILKRAIVDFYTEHSYGSEVAYIKLVLSSNRQEQKYTYESAKSLLKSVSKNIPSCAEVYTSGITFISTSEYIFFIEIRVKDSELNDENNIRLFHEIAHSSFNTNIGIIS